MLLCSYPLNLQTVNSWVEVKIDLLSNPWSSGYDRIKCEGFINFKDREIEYITMEGFEGNVRIMDYTFINTKEDNFLIWQSLPGQHTSPSEHLQSERQFLRFSSS